MRKHAEDQYREIPLGTEKWLYVRCTHVEHDDGKHTFVITSDALNFEAVRQEASAGIQKLCRDFQIAPTDLAYYERHPDGTLARADLSAEGGITRTSVPNGQWVREALGTTKLPRTEAELMQSAVADMARASSPSGGHSGTEKGQHWQMARGEHEFLPPNSTRDALVDVAEVKEVSGRGRTKIVLEGRPDSPVPSLENDAARNECVRSLAAVRGIEARDADWFVREPGGQLMSLVITHERSLREDPQYTAWMEKEANHPAKEVLKERWPDEPVWELHTAVEPLKESQQKALNDAFRDAYIHQPVDEYVRLTALSARDYESSQERIGGREIAEEYRQQQDNPAGRMPEDTQDRTRER